MQSRRLREALGKLAPIPETEWTYFEQQLAWRAIPKGEQVLWAGDICTEILFCAKGLFRIFYTLPDGTESNKSFVSESDFVASYSSMLLCAPSFLSIQALEPSEVAAFSHHTLKGLYHRHPCWEAVGRRIAENLYIKKEIRERQLLLLSAEERYEAFLSEFPDLEKRLSQYHIASYLGISPVSLSRIRRRR